MDLSFEDNSIFDYKKKDRGDSLDFYLILCQYYEGYFIYLWSTHSLTHSIMSIGVGIFAYFYP